MSMPKKPRKSKSKLIHVGIRRKWESILKDITKDEVPVQMLESITVNLLDDTRVSINIKDLIGQGHSPLEIEHRINSKLESLDDQIVDVDFSISIDAVANTIEPMTNNVLKNI